MTELLRAVSIGRQTRAGQWLIRDIDVQINGGDRLAIVGPTGSGKTVLLRSLALLDPLTQGEVFWRGEPVAGNAIPKFRRQAIYVGQRPAFVAGSVETNLRRVFDLRVASNQYDPQRVEQLLADLQLGDDFLAKNQADLSGGQRQLAALIRALQLNPLLLMLDEPTAALDHETALLVESLIANWLESDSNRAAIWVSHNEPQRQRVTDQVFRLPTQT